jgi:dipeptidyl aminopeptidase/acylaminoacyl peptidase
MEDARLSGLRKAGDADVFTLTRQTFREFPDLWITGGDLQDMEKVTDANPQQAEYRWGTAELMEWVSNDGIPLQGILVKPDGFDPSKKYPLMVYFYERNSDNLHSYRAPSPGTSVNQSFYVSRGYVYFVPDIPYEIGHPGESAIDAVVPGVLKIVDQGFIDADRIGAQGHSWGGYQLAYMITRTNLFAAVEAGAPVANMTSAYGGIRWDSGMNRQFQYEHTQSRIGGSLWEETLRYINNSPLFEADKIQTPLLMIHNDKDGAVPWYQGIEMYMALRRLQKPVWMLNYNGEPHGLRQRRNQKDWTIRMQQFFDHYLLDAPAAVWMTEGVPAVRKGETMGLEIRKD